MSADLTRYIPDALRSEQPLEKVTGNHAFVLLALELLVSAGKIADLLKKQVVYGKTIDRREWYLAFDAVGLDAMHAAGEATIADQFPVVLNFNPRLLHATLGAIGEEAELLEAMLESEDGEKPLDIVNVAEEAGDSMWYQALKLDEIGELGIPVTSVLRANIEKLKARFPDKFTLAASEGRDTAAERTVLEGSL